MPEPSDYLQPDEMTLRDYAAVVRRRKWFVIVPAVIVTTVAVLLSLTQDNRYRASADVLVQESASAISVNDLGGTASTRLINNELERASGSTLRDLVREVIGTEPDLDVKLARAKDVDVLVFQATSADAAFAAEAANAYANTYVDLRRKAVVSELDTRSAVVQGRLDEVDLSISRVSPVPEALLAQREQYSSELESLTVSAILAGTSGTAVIDAAQVPKAPFSPKPIRSGVLAMAVGVMVGLGAAFLVDYLDNSLRDEEGLAKASGLPVLAVIPKLTGWKKADHPHIISIEAPMAPSAEAYRGLRTSLQFLGIDRELKVIQVTSPKPGEGKTTTAVNLAVSHAKAGQRVVLVDCDLRKPRAHNFLDLPNESGLTTALLGRGETLVMQSIADAPNLKVITSGPIPPDPSEMLGGPRAARFFKVLAEQFDLVVLDSPPVLVVSDPLVISRHVDGVILVASAQSTDTRQVGRAAQMLAQIEAPVLGTVLNAFDTEKNRSYEYRYAYGSYEA